MKFAISGVGAKLTCIDQILSSTFGLSFWPVPTTAALQSRLGAQFGGNLYLIGWYGTLAKLPLLCRKYEIHGVLITSQSPLIRLVTHLVSLLLERELFISINLALSKLIYFDYY